MAPMPHNELSRIYDLAGEKEVQVFTHRQERDLLVESVHGSTLTVEDLETGAVRFLNVGNLRRRQFISLVRDFVDELNG